MDKSKRAPNFSKAEEKLLIGLVIKYQHIVRSKRTDVNSAKAKERVWNLIADEFNLSGSTIRDAMTLRRKFDNLKKRSKKVPVNEKVYSNHTPTVLISENIDEDVKPVIGDPLGGLPVMYENDVNCEEVSASSDTLLTINQEEIIPENWKECAPILLKSLTEMDLTQNCEENNNIHKNSTRSKLHKRKNSNEMWSMVGKAKLKLIAEQQKYMEEEHKLKLKFLEDEHNLKMELLKLDIELKKKQF